MTFIRNNSYSLLAVLLCVIIGFSSFMKLSTEPSYIEITIAEGDTLWELASQYADDSTSPQDWITQVQQINDLPSTTIKAGDSLRLPSLLPADEWKTTIELADRTE